MPAPKKIERGQRLAGIPSDSWNAFVDAERLSRLTTIPGVGPGQSTGDDEQVAMLVHNETGADLTARFPILRLTTPVVEPEDSDDDDGVTLRGVQFNANAPDSETGSGFVVMQGPCAADGFGRAVVQGLTWVRVDVGDADHTHATSVSADKDKLVSGTSGVPIKWKETGTGEKWAVIQLGSGGSTSAATFGILIADVPACSVSYAAADPFSSIAPGEAANAVIPMVRDELAFSARLNDDEDEQIKLKAINPVWPTIIKAGTTTNADKPVVVTGYTTTVGEGEGAEEVFIITNVIYPLTILKGLCQGAVSGSSFTADNLVVWWGRDPGVSSISAIANPASLDGDDNAVCVIMQITDGTWVCLGIECPA